MSESHEHFRIAEAAALSRKRDPAFASWATGYGVIEHDDVTHVRVYDMAGVLVQRGAVASRGDVYRGRGLQDEPGRAPGRRAERGSGVGISPAATLREHVEAFGSPYRRGSQVNNQRRRSARQEARR